MARTVTTMQPLSKAPSAGMLPAKGVLITDVQGHVNPKKVQVSRHNNEEVRWVSGGQSATIVFTGPQGSPFQAAVFHLPAGGSVSCGLPKSNAKYDTPYTYTVVGSTGAIIDPEVIIVR